MNRGTRIALFVAATLAALTVGLLVGSPASAHNAHGACKDGDAVFTASAYPGGSTYTVDSGAPVTFGGGFRVVLDGDSPHTVVVDSSDQFPTITLTTPICRQPAATTTTTEASTPSSTSPSTTSPPPSTTSTTSVTPPTEPSTSPPAPTSTDAPSNTSVPPSTPSSETVSPPPTAASSTNSGPPSTPGSSTAPNVPTAGPTTNPPSASSDLPVTGPDWGGGLALAALITVGAGIGLWAATKPKP